MPFRTADALPVKAPFPDEFHLRQEIGDFPSVCSGVHAQSSADRAGNPAKSGSPAKPLFRREVQQSGELHPCSGMNLRPVPPNLTERVPQFQETDLQRRIGADQVRSPAKRKNRHSRRTADRNH